MAHKFRYGIYLLISCVLILGYSNCGRIGFNAQNGMSFEMSSLGKTECDSALIGVYTSTWYPRLSVSCNSCHSAAHGSTDIATSFSAFMAKGSSLITFKASNPHGGNNVDLSSQIASFSGAWTAAQNEYVACLSREPAGGGGSSTGNQIALNGKIVPQINQTIANQAGWKTVTWDLESEVPSAYAGQFAAIFTIEARYALFSGAVVGMEFRNPRMRLKTATTAPIQVNAINLKINNALVSDVTTYTAVNAYIGSMTATDVAPSASTALAVVPVNDNSQISFVFTNLQANVPVTTSTMPASTTTTTMPSGPVTLANLLSTNPTLGVFNQSCVGCHNANNSAGGLNLTNSTQAIAKANTIVSRMNNQAMPMPPSGILNSTRIKVVEDWVAGGAKP